MMILEDQGTMRGYILISKPQYFAMVMVPHNLHEQQQKHSQNLDVVHL